MFLGVLKVGDRVEATFSTDHANRGSAHLLLGLGRFAGGASTATDTAAPGGEAKAALVLDAEGYLELVLDVATEQDRGRLELDVNGALRHGDDVQGDTRWAYSVER